MYQIDLDNQVVRINLFKKSVCKSKSTTEKFAYFYLPPSATLLAGLDPDQFKVTFSGEGKLSLMAISASYDREQQNRCSADSATHALVA
jgi:hypothetical protein